MAAPICAGVVAVSGQRRSRTRAGAHRSCCLWVADLRDHVVGLAELQLLPHQPLRLLILTEEQV